MNFSRLVDYEICDYNVVQTLYYKRQRTNKFHKNFIKIPVLLMVFFSDSTLLIRYESGDYRHRHVMF